MMTDRPTGKQPELESAHPRSGSNPEDPSRKKVPTAKL